MPAGIPLADAGSQRLAQFPITSEHGFHRASVLYMITNYFNYY